MKVILIIVAMFFIATLSVGDLYRASVDADYGFYKVANLDNPTKQISYTNKILYINTGDTIEWQSMSDSDDTMTIVSDSGLFYKKENRLRWSYKTFNYTFNGVGEHKIWIEEHPRFEQTIFVSDPIQNIPIVETTTERNDIINNSEIVVVKELPNSIPYFTTSNDLTNKSLVFGIVVTIFILIYLYKRRT